MGAPSSGVCCHSRVGNRDRVDAGGLPPLDLVAMPVNGPMVGAAEGNGEFIADPASHGSRLHESQVMGIARLPPAQQAWLRPHELQMGAIAIATRFADGPKRATA